MNKKAAAKFLNVSEKTVERYKSAGKLSARLKRVVGEDGKTRSVLDFNESDLEKLKQSFSAETLFPMVEVEDRHPQTKTETDLTRQTQTDNLSLELSNSSTIGQTATVRLFEAILGQFESLYGRHLEASEINQKLVLTEVEASRISGLPKNFLVQARKDGTLKSTFIGGRWRIKRADLDKFVKSL